MFPEFVSQFVASSFVVQRRPSRQQAPTSNEGVEVVIAPVATADNRPSALNDNFAASVHTWINIALATVIGVFGVLILLRG